MTVANYSATDRATNDLITNTVWNQDVVENTKFLHSPPGAQGRESGAQTIATATPTALELDGTPDFDTDDMHDTVTNNTRITCKTAGLYFIWGFTTITLGPAATSSLSIEHSGGDTVAKEIYQTGGVTGVYMNVAGFYQMAVDEYVEFYVEHDTGSNELSGNVVAGMHWIANGAATP